MLTRPVRRCVLLLLTSTFCLAQVSVRDSGAVGDGVHDDTANIRAAIASCSGPCSVVFPPGTYKITHTIQVSGNGVSLVGSGAAVSILDFEPLSDGIAVLFQSGNPAATDLYSGSVRSLSIFSRETKFAKTALQLVAVSSMTVEDVDIGGFPTNGYAWTGGRPSVGLRIQGHDHSSIGKMQINADLPISIEPNPLSPYPTRGGPVPIDIDHFHFHDLYLIAGSYPCITIASVWLTQVTFDGREAWVGGTHGLYWRNTTAGLASNGLVLSNVRTEQGVDPTAYSVFISSSSLQSQLQNIVVTAMNADPGRNGICLRGTFWTTLQNFIYGGPGVALDANATNQRLVVHNSFFQVGSSLGPATSLSPAPFRDGWVNTNP